MTPAPLSPDVLVVRLRSMRELLADLSAVGEVTAARLEGDRMLRHAVERVLTQLVDLAVAVNSHAVAAEREAAPTDYRSSFRAAGEVGLLEPELASRLAGSVGLRNVLVHEYVSVDLHVVAASVGLALDQYGAYVRQVGAWLAARG